MEVLKDSAEAIPFADHPLTAFIPGFEASLNGRSVIAHVDTGGTFLPMGVERAHALGIEVVKGRRGRHGAMEVDLYEGTAERFDLGPIRMSNVPITAMSSLTGPQDLVVFGTNLLQQFLPTLDYPKRMLILRAKDARDAEEYTNGATAIPFRLLGDHYMIAEGGIGGKSGLNFFIDSGLVSLHPDGKGGLRQAAFIAARGDLLGWGIDLSAKLESGAVELKQQLTLGPLTQEGHLILAPERRMLASMDGVEVHGLLSHAFLKRYAWTIDFDAGMYYFRE